ncbi:MAG: FkbM family methyltransferase [Alphaproteobacteria bacterium]|jgi:FkbM family methyltransferase
MSDQPSPPAPEWVHWLAWATRRFQPKGIDRIVRMLYPPGNDRPIRSVVDYDDGLLFHCDTQSFLEWYIFFYGAFRPEVSRLINRMLRPGQVAIDIGANVGMHSVIMANRVGPTGHVVVFEPDPHPMGRLRRNMALNGIDWVTTVEAAVSARSETRTFYLHDDTIGNFANASLVAANVGKQTASVEMQVVSIDEWMRDNPLPRVDVVKLLAQGEEYNALQGMRGLIERDRPKIFFLYEPSYWHRQDLELMDAVKFFAGHGYGVQEVEFRSRREVVGEIPKGQVFLATP